MPNRSGVFISYSRADGEAFATDLYARLKEELPGAGFVWLDRARMQSGTGWWKQIEDAINQVEYMVLVMTRQAMSSETARKEWRYARQQGVSVLPVKGAADHSLHFASLPRWMQKVHFTDPANPHEWQRLLQQLRSPCQITRVPFMAPDLAEGFVQRPAELDTLRRQLLDPDRQDPLAITTALRGAGGFGKTTLATALCHDGDIQTAFTDGILWVTLGEHPRVLEGLSELYAALTGERPPFVNEEDAAVELAKGLEDKNCLIVIDDAWHSIHARSFLRGGKGCARLITTRLHDVAAYAGARPVNVG